MEQKREGRIVALRKKRAELEKYEKMVNESVIEPALGIAAVNTASLCIACWHEESDLDVAVGYTDAKGRSELLEKAHAAGWRKRTQKGENVVFTIEPTKEIPVDVDVQIRPQREIDLIREGGRKAWTEYSEEAHVAWLEKLEAGDEHDRRRLKLENYRRLMPSMAWQ